AVEERQHPRVRVNGVGLDGTAVFAFVVVGLHHRVEEPLRRIDGDERWVVAGSDLDQGELAGFAIDRVYRNADGLRVGARCDRLARVGPDIQVLTTPNRGGGRVGHGRCLLGERTTGGTGEGGQNGGGRACRAGAKNCPPIIRQGGQNSGII